jgi:hypothetical protein
MCLYLVVLLKGVRFNEEGNIFALMFTVYVGLIVPRRLGAGQISILV